MTTAKSLYDYIAKRFNKKDVKYMLVPLKSNWFRKNWSKFSLEDKKNTKVIESTNVISSLIPAQVWFDELAEWPDKKEKRKYLLGHWKKATIKKPLPTAHKT